MKDINQLRGIEQNEQRENKNISLICSMRNKGVKVKGENLIIKMLEERGVFN